MRNTIAASLGFCLVAMLGILCAGWKLTAPAVTYAGVQYTSFVAFDGGGSAVAAGTYYNFPITLSEDATLIAWELTSSESGTCSVGISKSTYADWPTLTSILGVQTVGITASDKATDTDIANWGETMLTAGTRLVVTVNSASETGICLNITAKTR